MRVILCNCPPEAAEALAEAMVVAGLAACVNLLPGVRSIYVWQGAVCRDAETTLLLKVAAEGVDALRAALVAAHPYDCPEVLVLPVDVAASHQPYVDWVRAARAVTPGA
jgi:periplasmic divalent cation tolerance protein